MGHQILKQPDGRLAVFSSFTDTSRAAYFQFAHTWEEACQLNQGHGGDLTYTGDATP